MNQVYVSTVQLLLAVTPVVFESKFFALKGGTALNLFVQDLPRLSVDIDVVFTDHELDREQALATIKSELALIERVQLHEDGLDIIWRDDSWQRFCRELARSEFVAEQRTPIDAETVE